MSTLRWKDRASLCSFTFADGRRCRTPRQSGHPYLCCFHAHKEAQAHAAEEVGREVAHFFSRDYLSACDLNAALGLLLTATVRGHLPPRTSRTLAYLAQVMVQCIQITEHEYSNTFGSNEWRHAVKRRLRVAPRPLRPRLHLTPPHHRAARASPAWPPPTPIPRQRQSLLPRRQPTIPPLPSPHRSPSPHPRFPDSENRPTGKFSFLKREAQSAAAGKSATDMFRMNDSPRGLM